MSLAARLLNVFAIPGEVFEVVKASRISVGNWLLPMCLSALVGALTVIVNVSQPAVQKQMRERFEHQAKAALGQLVKAGNVKQADADRVLAQTRGVMASPTLRTFLVVWAPVFGAARVFWWGLVLWLLGRLFLKVRLNYFKTLEVAGLALMIGVLGSVVTLLLMVNLPRVFAAPNLTLAVSHFDPLGESPLLLGVISVFSFWLILVLSIGLAKLARVPFLRAAWFVIGYWVIQESFLLLVIGALGLFALYLALHFQA
jgi:hypothetical protein